VRQNLLDHHRIFHAGDHLHRATARVAGLNVKLRLFQGSFVCPIDNKQHNEHQNNGCHDGGIQYSQGMVFLN
jgi:uncharacterized protein (UPF0305 family)